MIKGQNLPKTRKAGEEESDQDNNLVETLKRETSTRLRSLKCTRDQTDKGDTYPPHSHTTKFCFGKYMWKHTHPNILLIRINKIHNTCSEILLNQYIDSIVHFIIEYAAGKWIRLINKNNVLFCTISFWPHLSWNASLILTQEVKHISNERR